MKTAFSPMRVVVGCVFAHALAGCAQTTPHWDAQFGDSVRVSMAQQTRNLDAGRTKSAVDGMDGRAAGEAIERYNKSFKEPTPHVSGLNVTLTAK